MVALVIVAVLANVLHPIAWTWEELRFAVGAPIAARRCSRSCTGSRRGDAAAPIELGPVIATPIQLGFVALLAAGVVYAGFYVVGRFGFGPLAVPPAPDDPAAILEPPAEAPRGWLRLGAGLGPAGRLAGRRAARHPDRAVRRLVHPVGVRREPPARSPAGRPATPARRCSS